jgi:holo-[acyl-carrier protein] synthase
VDAVDVDRFRRVMERRPGLTDAVFTDAEQTYALKAANSTERFAARFAAKEAVLKALGAGVTGKDLSEIEVVRGDNGAPTVVLSGRVAAMAEKQGVTRWHVSLTHTDQVAIASVIAESDGAAEPPADDDSRAGEVSGT